MGGAMNSPPTLVMPCCQSAKLYLPGFCSRVDYYDDDDYVGQRRRVEIVTTQELLEVHVASRLALLRCRQILWFHRWWSDLCVQHLNYHDHMFAIGDTFVNFAGDWIPLEFLGYKVSHQQHIVVLNVNQIFFIGNTRILDLFLSFQQVGWLWLRGLLPPPSCHSITSWLLLLPLCKSETWHFSLNHWSHLGSSTTYQPTAAIADVLEENYKMPPWV